MAEITASLVKELRERTGAGMMECKKALTESNGDIDAAAEALRKSGLAKADKKASRVAAEGRIAVAQAGGKAVLVEINSETDFVAKDANFVAFTDAVAQAALAAGSTDVEALKAATLPGGETVEEARAAAIAKLGENILVRRIATIDTGNNVAAYSHGGKIGVLVEVNCETDFVARGELFQEFCKNVCLQICSTAPRWVRRDEATPEEIEAEKAIYAVQAKESGRPETVQQKIVEGKLNKWLKENSLLDQEFVKNPDVTIEELMKELSGKIGEKIDIRRFARFQLGEAIDGRKPAGDEE